MATAERDLKATLAELEEAAKDPEKLKGFADFAELEAILDRLMPWEESLKPGYDRATLFEANPCQGWLDTFGYALQRFVSAGPDQSTWLDRALVCAEEYEACVEL